MRRRTLLATAPAAALVAPGIVRAQGATTLKFIPYANPPVLDPVVTNNYAVRNHALMVFDTLYGIDDQYDPQPQMVEGHVVEQDGRQWTLTLRDGLRFHDGTPVLGRDVVASLRRWAKRDGLGGSLMAATDELSAPTDRTVSFQLKAPFPLLPFALGKATLNIAAIMPERLAASDPFKPISEMVGSGPYRFVANEYVGGELGVYQRFGRYVARQGGVPSFLAGPKIAHFERVEWHILSDPATAAGALQKGEMDWWELPTSEYWPLLKAHGALRVELLDRSGSYGLCSLNHLQPPFDNPATRRAALAAISQQDVQIAAYGTDPTTWRTHVGYFPPDSAIASADGLDALKEPPDLDRARRMLKDSGYNGQKTVILYNPAVPWHNAGAQVVAQAWHDIGFDVELAGDMTTLVKRMGNKGPVDAGGWSAEIDAMAGLAADIPVSNYLMRGDGSTYGWAIMPRMEVLRSAWLVAPDLAARREISRQMQVLCFDQVPYIPTGMALRPTAYSNTLTGVLHGVPLFYNVQRT
jgi:peptide/nickel transport system substrate-binding protein